MSEINIIVPNWFLVLVGIALIAYTVDVLLNVITLYLQHKLLKAKNR